MESQDKSGTCPLCHRDVPATNERTEELVDKSGKDEFGEMSQVFESDEEKNSQMMGDSDCDDENEEPKTVQDVLNAPRLTRATSKRPDAAKRILNAPNNVDKTDGDDNSAAKTNGDTGTNPAAKTDDAAAAKTDDTTPTKMDNIAGDETPRANRVRVTARGCPPGCPGLPSNEVKEKETGEDTTDDKDDEEEETFEPFTQAC